LGLFVITGLISCTTSEPIVRTQKYHQQEKPYSQPIKLNGLQIKAIQLMNQLQFSSSIQYLQRAINVEPRDPLNWHYLAQNYWHLKDFEQCRSMVKRSVSYSQFNPDLSRANKALLKQCHG